MEINRFAESSQNFRQALTVKMEITPRKMEHLREWKEIVCANKISEESHLKLEYVEMLRYPHRQQSLLKKGYLSHSTLSDWLHQVISGKATCRGRH